MARYVNYKQEDADKLMEKFNKEFEILINSEIEVDDKIDYIQKKLNLTNEEIDIVTVELHDQYIKSRFGK